MGSSRVDAGAAEPHRSFLDGVRIVEIGDGVAGSAATGALASLGAAIVKVAGDKRDQNWAPIASTGDPRSR